MQLLQLDLSRHYKELLLIGSVIHLGPPKDLTSSDPSIEITTFESLLKTFSKVH